jgi:antitoxin ParD1/3/4
MAILFRNGVGIGEHASTCDAGREKKKRRKLLGYSVEELRDLLEEGIVSGPSSRATMADVKAEARHRFDRRTR